MSRNSRGPRGAGFAIAGAALLAACTGTADDPPASQQPNPRAGTAQVSAPAVSTVLDSGGAVGLSVRASAAVWVASPVAITVTTDADSITQAARLATSLAVPALVVPGNEATDGAGPIRAELDRLGVTHVLHVGPGVLDLPGIEVVTSIDDLPDHDPPSPLDGVLAVTVAGKQIKGMTVALATLEAAGADSLALTQPDPRVDPVDVAAMAQADPTVAIAVGSRFGPQDVFGGRVATAVTGVQLPGGGQTIFDDKRYVALYGHPLTGGLGVLGEQGPKGSVARARKVAAQYEGLSGQTIVPAFEIIATVASGGPGDDRNYSNEWDVDVLRPLVDAAREAGIYVVLDLQSGRSDFLSQATGYEELLREPHVGLALDPEWRLKKGEKPLQQIGSVRAAEINRTLDWLAELTDEYDLPQKMVLLHQFRTDMIPDRDDVDLTHDELAVIVQMDGDGTLGQKLDTWRNLRAGAPEELRFGWKNFYDEDEPTPSPATTFQVQPKPWWVSYQ